MTLLRELISIPVQVHASEFVISLKDGWAEPQRVLDDYVVTEQLEGCFDRALGLVEQAITNRKSMGAYLHGSFGSGKSHFMAMLHQLLTDGSPARTSSQFGNVWAKHVDALSGKRFLLVPVHFIGGDSMGQQILGGYVDYVRRLHPEASTPAVYIDDDLIANAVTMRKQFGDEAFFAQLAQASGSGGWGGYDDWDAERFDAACTAPQGSDDRRDLVSALLDTVLSSYASAVESSGKGFIPLEAGLAVVSQHASALGYAGVVLFLDEMILWFASRMADQAFVNREASLVAKLVECEHSERPAPIVSFIARQRDLRELVGDLPGADKANFSDILKFWEGRFETVTIEDRNLVAITERRVLKPVSEDARQTMAASFAAVQEKVELQQHLDILLGGTATVDHFRRVYPFNPALIDTLVALSSALQRDRTALKVMLQLLSEHRDRLQLGELVPFGDLYDVIAREADPFTDTMKAQFVNARKLWETRLAPMLLADHGLVGEDAAANLPSSHSYWVDARLLKTLLLGALVPETPSLRGMTISRLVALNHGTIRVPFAGTESVQVLGKLRSWASQIGEIRLGEDQADPSVSIHLTGIDLEPLLDAVSNQDNVGQRNLLVRNLVESRLDLHGATGFLPTFDMIWRGSRRVVDVVIDNVCDKERLPDPMFRSTDNVRLVIDLPLDMRQGVGPKDDFDRVDTDGTTLGNHDTIVWLPNFFSTPMLNALGRLVRIKYLVNGNNLETNASGLLSAEERGLAKAQLEAQRDVLVSRLGTAIDVAYGLVNTASQDIANDLPLHQQFNRLGDGTAKAEVPPAHTLGDAAKHLAGQMLAGRYPSHPEFGDKLLTMAELRLSLDYMERLAATASGRLDGVAAPDRAALRRVLNSLRLAEMFENHIVASRIWPDRLQQQIASQSPTPLTVGHLRRFIDTPKAHGLDKPVADLVILSFCALTNRVLRVNEQPVNGELGKLDDSWHVYESELPAEDVWERAVARAKHLGLTTAVNHRSATSTERLANEATTAYAGLARFAVEYDKALSARLAVLGIDPTMSDRARTAGFAAKLVGKFGHSTLSTLNALGGVDSPTSWGAVGTSAKKSEEMLTALQDTNWALLEGAISRGTPGAMALKSRLHTLLLQDQIGAPLVAGLKELVDDATKLAFAPASGAPSKLTRQDAESRLQELRVQLLADASLKLSWEIVDARPDSGIEP